MQKLKYLVCLLFLFSGVLNAKQIFVGESITLEAQQHPDILYYTWTIMDGESATILEGPEVVYAFENSGAQKIMLKVETADGNDHNILTKPVFVLNSGKPTAIIEVQRAESTEENYLETTIPELKNLTFVSKSTDKTGATDSGNLNETWSVDGRTLYSKNQIYDYLASEGEHKVRLLISEKNNSNARDEAYFIIKVADQEPEINGITITPDPELNQKKIKVSVDAEDPDESDSVDKGIINYRFEILEYGKIIAVSIPNPAMPETIFSLNLPAGNHDLRFCVTIKDKNYNQKKDCKDFFLEISENVDENKAPVIDEILPGTNITVKQNELFQVEAVARDEDQDYLTYKWYLDGIKIGQQNATLRHRIAESGSYRLELRITDGIDEVKQEVFIDVEDDPEAHNSPPEARIKGVFPGNTGDSQTRFSFYAEATDPDKDHLDIMWEVRKDGFFKNLFSENFALVAQTKNFSYIFRDPGDYEVRLTVSDGEESVEESISVEVVAEGETIPPSTVEPYIDESESTLSLEDVVLNTPQNQKVNMALEDYIESLDEVTETMEDDLVPGDDEGKAQLMVLYKILENSENQKLLEDKKEELEALERAYDVAKSEEKPALAEKIKAARQYVATLEEEKENEWEPLTQEEGADLMALFKALEQKMKSTDSPTEKAKLEAQLEVLQQTIDNLKDNSFGYPEPLTEEDVQNLLDERERIKEKQKNTITAAEKEALEQKISQDLTEDEKETLEEELYNPEVPPEERERIESQLEEDLTEEERTELERELYNPELSTEEIDEIVNQLENDLTEAEKQSLENELYNPDISPAEKKSLENQLKNENLSSAERKKIENRLYNNNISQSRKNEILRKLQYDLSYSQRANLESTLYNPHLSPARRQIIEAKLRNDLTPEQRRDLEKQLYNPHLTETEREKIKNQLANDLTESERAQLESQLKNPVISEEDEENMKQRLRTVNNKLERHGKAENFQMFASPNTRFFLYGRANPESNRALFFQWDMGDYRLPDEERIIYGQIVKNFQYPPSETYPQEYEVTFTVSDGIKEISKPLKIILGAQLENTYIQNDE